MTLYICSNCGYGSASWLGRCPDCGQWKTFVEKFEEKKSTKEKLAKASFVPLAKIKSTSSQKKIYFSLRI
jgi:DNA repair protein RadA/Sms